MGRIIERVPVQRNDHLIEDPVRGPTLDHRFGPCLLVELAGPNKQPGEPARRLREGRDALLHFGSQRFHDGAVIGIGWPRGAIAPEPRLRGSNELGRGECLDVLRVDVAQLLEVEHRGRLIDRFKGEPVDDLCDRTDLDLVGRTPPQQCKRVQHRLRQVPVITERRQRNRVATLREFLALLVHKKRQVGVGRLLAKAQRIPQQHHLRGRVEQVLAPDHVGDPHLVIVDGVGDQEHGTPVAATNHEILDGVMTDLDPAPHEIIDDGHALVRGSESHHDTGTVLDVPVTRPAVVTTLVARFFIERLDLFRRQVAVIGMPRIEQLLDGGQVLIQSLGLEVRTFIPVEPEPPQRLSNCVDELLRRLLGVGVLNPKDEGPARVAGEQPVEQCRTGAADMEKAGGSRREADAGSTHPGEATGVRSSNDDDRTPDSRPRQSGFDDLRVGHLVVPGLALVIPQHPEVAEVARDTGDDSTEVATDRPTSTDGLIRAHPHHLGPQRSASDGRASAPLELGDVPEEAGENRQVDQRQNAETGTGRLLTDRRAVLANHQFGRHDAQRDVHDDGAGNPENHQIEQHRSESLTEIGWLGGRTTVGRGRRRWC